VTRMVDKQGNLVNNDSSSEASEICPQCGKTKRAIKMGSLTSWIFGENRCQCQPLQSQLEAIILPQSNLPVQFEQFEILGLIGHGGMGSVYKVSEKGSGRTLAIKVMRDDLVSNSVAVKRFEQEVKACMSLSHQNLVTVYSIDHLQDGKPYLVMDYLDGRNLQDILTSDSSLTVDQTLAIFIQVCDGLSRAHQSGIVHRDIKPSNIMLVANGESDQDQVKLLDFGIARVTGDQNLAQSLTSTGEIFGSPLYMSPEQCKGENVDTRSDIYSVGCVLYEALSGKPPFKGANPVQTILKHLNDEPKSLVDKRLGISDALDTVVLKCLAKDPQERYQTADDLARDLKYLKVGLEPLAPRKKQPTTKFNRQAVVRLSLIALSLTVTFVAVGTIWLMSMEPSLEKFTKQLSQNPNDVEALTGRAFLYKNKGQLTDAISDFDKAIELNPNNANAYRWRGSSYTGLGQYDKARADLEKSISLFPDSRPILDLAVLEYMQGNYERSIALCTKHLEMPTRKELLPLGVLEANYSLALQTRANCQLKLKNYSKAIADCNEALKIYPKDQEPLRIRADAEHRSKQYQAALDDANAFLSIKPKDWNTLYTRAQTYRHLDRRKEAESDFSELITFVKAGGYKDERYVVYFFERGRLRALMGNFDGAIEDFLDCRNYTTETSYILPSLAQARLATGQFDEAAKDLRQYMKDIRATKKTLSPASITQYYLLEKLLKHNVEAEDFLTAALSQASSRSRTLVQYYLAKPGDKKSLAAEDLKEMSKTTRQTIATEIFSNVVF